MAILPAVALQFLPNHSGAVLVVRLLSEDKVLQDGGLHPLAFLIRRLQSWFLLSINQIFLLFIVS